MICSWERDSNCTSGASAKKLSESLSHHHFAYIRNTQLSYKLNSLLSLIFCALCLPLIAVGEENQNEWVRIGGESESGEGKVIAEGAREIDTEQKRVTEEREILNKERLSLAEEKQKFEEERVKFAQERLEFEQERAAFYAKTGYAKTGKASESQPVVAENKLQESVEAEPAPNEIVRRTRLRVDGKAMGRWKQTAKLKLEEITAYVRNSGDVTAKEVKVIAVIPGGKKIVLTGPSTLEPGQKELFSATPGEVVTRAGEIVVNPTCSNCWK